MAMPGGDQVRNLRVVQAAAGGSVGARRGGWGGVPRADLPRCASGMGWRVTSHGRCLPMRGLCRVHGCRVEASLAPGRGRHAQSVVGQRHALSRVHAWVVSRDLLPLLLQRLSSEQLQAALLRQGWLAGGQGGIRVLQEEAVVCAGQTRGG